MKELKSERGWSRSRSWLGAGVGVLGWVIAMSGLGPAQAAVNAQATTVRTAPRGAAQVVEAATDAGKLQLEGISSEGWAGLGYQDPTELAKFELQRSEDLSEWETLAILHRAPFVYWDVGAKTEAARFYQVVQTPLADKDLLKHQIFYPEDPFLSESVWGGPGEVRWVKFAILAEEPGKVYYQNSRRYVFHYDFAVAELPTFAGMTRSQFDDVTLRRENQKAVLGAVLFSPQADVKEVGVQFVGLDAYPVGDVLEWLRWIQASVAVDTKTEGEPRFFYMPVFEQGGLSSDEEKLFGDNGFPVSSPARWLVGDACYANGWAVGRLKFVAADEIADAYRDGRLTPEDILLTDQVPAEVPFVAGIISLAPSTPNSHVAILARSYGVPFVHLVDPLERERVLEMAGREVMMRTEAGFEICHVDVVDVEGELSDELRAELRDLKAAPAIRYTPKGTFGGVAVPVDELTPEDVVFVGGKAANFGFLRRTIPENSPEAIALTFDLWDSFMSQEIEPGRRMGEMILEVMSGHSYPPDMERLQQDLASIRGRILNGQFAPAQSGEVLAALGRFDAARKIRFRSSTNLEDTETFTGAGLYDSYSGCLLDDLDGDDEGPSHCDADRRKERGVFRAIRKVYASFYNENAVLERLRHGVVESEVGMAILVHHSFPDEIEWANGVGTLRFSDNQMMGELVTQAGATSVANPDSSAQPEVVGISRFSFGSSVSLRQRSSLVPLGGYVMEWEQDYRDLEGLLSQVGAAYRNYFGGKQEVLLDFEYKKVAPGDLVVKQVREIPLGGGVVEVDPFLINDPTDFCVFQGEYADVFANHRLKSFWSLSTRSMQMTAENLSTPIYRTVAFEVRDGLERVKWEGEFSELPELVHSVDGDRLVDQWSLPAVSNWQWAELSARPWEGGRSPLRLLRDFEVVLTVEYKEPVYGLGFSRDVEMRNRETVRLVPCREPASTDLLQEREMTVGDLRIVTRFYWPKPPQGFSAGYTAPLVGWESTRIEGLTTEPIVLTDSYAQTYRPEHHNFAEHFIYEPALDPAVPESVLAELRDANIQMLHVEWDFSGTRVTVIGVDERARPYEPRP